MSSRSLAVALVGAVVALASGLTATGVLAAPSTRHVNPAGFDVKIIGSTLIPNLSCAKANPCRTIKWAVETVAKGGDTVSVAAGTYHERVTVGKNLTIIGAGADKTIVDGDAAGSVFKIQGSVTAQFKRLRIRDGKASQGGGVSVSGASALSLTNVTLTGNQAESGGGINNYGTLSLSRVVISGNQGTSNSGGGLTNVGKATLDRTDIYGNSAVYGAAIHNTGPLIITNSAIHGNTSGNGYPGIFNSGGALSLTNTTVSGNTSTSPGNQGGAISQSGGSTTLRYVTIAGNTQGHYGAIYSFAGSVITSNSIVFGNGAGSQCGGASIGLFTDGGYNVEADGSCVVFPGSGSIIANPQLKALVDNGGFTPTQALKSTSPAIDLVPAGKCVAKDQRLVARPKDGDGNGTARCDAGSFEYP